MNQYVTQTKFLDSSEPNLSFNIEELCDEQRPIEGQLYHVVPPDTRVYVVAWIVPPAVQHVPGPGLVPHDEDAHHVSKNVEGPSPTSLTEFVCKTSNEYV